MSSFLVLVVKYVGGSLDLLLAPLLILLLNKEVRRGVTLIYRSVRDKGYHVFNHNPSLTLFEVEHFHEGLKPGISSAGGMSHRTAENTAFQA